MRLGWILTPALAIALALPGSAHLAQAKGDSEIRLATLAPNGSEFVKGFKKINAGLKKATGGKWKIRLYPSGIAGDEKDVLRKMRAGQMDGTAVTSVGLAQVLKELSVLTAPGAIETYAQLERVQKAFNAEWNKKLDANGYRVLGWGEIGQLRYFSKAPIRTPDDMKKMRPWVWPESHTMKAMWHAIGCTGVPLGVPEVYGALQTGMIDMITSTAVAVAALQWHTKLDHVTAREHGPLVGAMVISADKWKSMPEDVRKALGEQITMHYENDRENMRKTDKRTYAKLLKRGYTAVEYSAAGEKQLKKYAEKARESLVGRVYSQALLDRVIEVAGKK
jgi:TRAP-type C4-dicarboxylate transport system substrate-binding protein